MFTVRANRIGIGCLASASVAAGLVILKPPAPRSSSQLLKSKPFRISRPVADGVSGAVGEVIQILLLYPIESIKVRCQDQSIGWRAVLQKLFAPGGGGVGALYRGIGSSAILSIAVGAVHWLSFSFARRMVLPSEELKPHTLESTHTASTTEPHSLDKQFIANLSAAGIGALCTALIESPVEEYRHKSQAGVIKGSLGGEMIGSIRKFGILSLYSGFLPFLFEALPYDITELASYSQLQACQKAAARASPSDSLLRTLPDHFWDATLGGLAGAAAVLVSMPCDTLKTYIQCHHTAGASSPQQQIRDFATLGKTFVRERGLKSLFIGLTPRLVQQVPGSACCWWGISQCQKALEPWVA